VDAIVVTGSPLSVTDRAPWMAAAGAWLLEQAERGVPVLGVCFGHQLLAETAGGAVGRSPLGREIGTVRCALTAAGRDDPLFEGVPSSFDAQATHEDEVRRLPPGAELLATNAWSRVQAFRLGARVRAVQFHPEMDAASMSAAVSARAGTLPEEARVREGIRASPFAARILRNFVRLAGERRRGTSPRATSASPTPPSGSRRA
jgi:GMP synthase (glutamine-hydrolysing)